MNIYRAKLAAFRHSPIYIVADTYIHAAQLLEKEYPVSIYGKDYIDQIEILPSKKILTNQTNGRPKTN